MKKVLFIAPNFYKYHNFIKKGLEKFNFEVDYFDDRPSTSFLTKSLIRINKKSMNKKIDKYFDVILNISIKKQYDIVFMIYGQSFSIKHIKKLKEVLPNAKYIFYMYDPISSMPDRVEFANEFEKKYTFDYLDSIKYPQFKLRPLFYSYDEYKIKEIENDACFVGTMMPGKYLIEKEIVSQLKKNGYNVLEYKFVQSKIVLLYYKLKYKEFKKAKFKEFNYKRLTFDECNHILETSNYVIDCPKEGQSGLTIRTFECLAANKKMITTNQTIVNYDFYRPENIYVFKGKIDFNDVFFKSQYVKIDNDIKNKYSLQSWIKEIFEI